MGGELERPRLRSRLKGWLLLNGGLALLLVLPVTVVVMTSVLRPAGTVRADRSTTTTLNGLEQALRALPRSGTKPSEQEVAQQMRDLVLAAQATEPAVPPAFAAEDSPSPSPALGVPAGAPTNGGTPTNAGAPTTYSPVTGTAPTTEPGTHRPPPPPTTAPAPPPVTAPTTVPMTASAWKAEYGSMLGTLLSEVTNAAYYSGSGSDFSQFAANVTAAEHYPPIPTTGAFADYASAAWQQAMAALSTLVADGELCLRGNNRDCHEKRLASMAASYLAYARADLQGASTLGE